MPIDIETPPQLAVAGEFEMTLAPPPPGPDFWHATHVSQGILLHNAVLGNGWVVPASSGVFPNGVGTQYGLLKGNSPKEQAWEHARLSVDASLPSRVNALFLFDDFEIAQRLAAGWFAKEERVLLRVRVPPSTQLYRADAKHLNATPDAWESHAFAYWTGKMTDDPWPELVTNGPVYFPDWQKPPFKILTG